MHARTRWFKSRPIRATYRPGTLTQRPELSIPTAAHALTAQPDRETVALIDASTGRSWIHAELALEVEAKSGVRSGASAGGRSQTPGSVVGYLGALAAGHAVALVDEALDPDALDEIVRR